MRSPGNLPIAGAFIRQFIERSKCPPEEAAAVLVRVGIDPASLFDPGLRVSEQQFTRLLNALARVSRDEFWGMASTPVPLGTFRIFCRLIVNCRTVGEALTVGARYYQLFIRDFALKVRSEGEYSVIWLKLRAQHLDLDRRQEMQGAALFIAYQLMCWLSDRRLPVESVHFGFSEGPRSADPLKAYQTSVVHFDQPYTGLRMRQHLLALPVLADERRLRRFLTEPHHSMLVRFHDQHRIDDKVKAILRRNLGTHIELEEIASSLNMTAVTLRRRLADECGMTYSDLRDAARRDAALEMVSDAQAKLEAVASQLGFAEYSTFHRAFRRWTGASPTEYREQANRKG